MYAALSLHAQRLFPDSRSFTSRSQGGNVYRCAGSPSTEVNFFIVFNLPYDVKAARKKLLHEYGALRRRLNECSVSLLPEDEDKFIITPSVSDALDLLVTSDNRIGLLTEAQLLAQDDELAVGGLDKTRNSESSGNSITINGDESMVSDDQLRKVLADTLIDNARLRKQVNSVIRCAIKNVEKSEKDDRDDIPS